MLIGPTQMSIAYAKNLFENHSRIVKFRERKNSNFLAECIFAAGAKKRLLFMNNLALINS
jgi:hypothetical protein